MRGLIEKRLFEIRDIEDPGLGGKEFEKVFVKALKLVGLEFKGNITSGPGWDIHTIGSGWLKLISEKNVNIKVYGTKWMFSSSELAKKIPWDRLTDNYNSDRTEKAIRDVFRKKEISKIYFLKPKTKDIQNRIIKYTKDGNVDALRKTVVKKNFKFEKLGRNYSVRVLDNGDRVTSVAILKNGKVFMRSEKPRKMGGVMTVAFRAPTPKLSKTIRRLANLGNAEEI